MEFKGTKGKWEVLITNGVESHLDIAINSDNSDCIAWVYSKSSYKNINGLANAKLIASSPEMFEMLVNLNKYINEISKTNNFKFIADVLQVNEIEQLLTKITE